MSGARPRKRAKTVQNATREVSEACPKEQNSSDNGNTTDDNPVSVSRVPSNGTTGESRLDRETNPMMNPVILKHLFEISPPYYLFTYRQVCKLWNDVSLDRFRSVVAVRTTIRHRKPSDDDEGIPVYFDSRGRPRLLPRTEGEEFRDVTISELLRYINIPFFKLDTKPYKNYDLRGVQYNDTVKRKDQRMMRFWRVYGPLMQELRFGGFKFDNVETFRDLFCRWTPNLRKLNLHLNPKEIPDGICDPSVVVEKQIHLNILSINLFANLFEENRFPLPWFDFLSVFPNLNELELSFLFNFAEFNKVLEAIERIRSVNRDHLKLRKLDISRVKREAVVDFPIETARLFQELRLPLERLDADIGYKTNTTSMQIILKSHHKTLKWLSLFRAPFTGPFQNFPFHIQFDALKVLELYGPFTWDFSFLRFTPNLEKLYVFLDANFISYLPIFMRIYRRNLERKVDFLDDMVAATVGRFDMSTVKLEHLNTFLGEFEIKSPESIRILARWMPNLKHLGLHLGKTTFPTVCEQFPELTCLCIYGHNDVDDEAITGIPPGCALGSRTSSRIGRQLVPVTRPPNITNLTKLTSFTLSRPSNHPFECRHLVPKLTDHSVTYGFLCLSQLKHLSLSMASFVSRKNYEALKKKMRQDCITLIVSKTCSCGR